MYSGAHHTVNFIAMYSKEKLYIYTGEAIHKSSLHSIQLGRFDVVRIDSTFSWTTQYLAVRPVKYGHTVYSVYLENLMPYEEFPEDVPKIEIYLIEKRCYEVQSR